MKKNDILFFLIIVITLFAIYWKRDEEEGLGIIKDILSEQPESFKVHNRIGLLSLQDLIRVRQALVHFNRSLKLNPSQPKVESIILRLNEDYLQKLNVVRTENDS